MNEKDKEIKMSDLQRKITLSPNEVKFYTLTPDQPIDIVDEVVKQAKEILLREMDVVSGEMMRNYVATAIHIRLYNDKLKESMEFLKEAAIEPAEYERFYESENKFYDVDNN